jgi:RHS repeat-associated protein
LYDSDSTRVGFTYNGTAYYYTKNAQGDVTGIVDNNYNPVVQYSYDAWGKLLSTTGTLASTIGKINPFLYRGYYFDTETGLYYLNSRYYDAQTGRFVSEDGQFNPDTGLSGNNLFAYCNNDPINMSDPSGCRSTADDGTGRWVFVSSSGKVFQGGGNVSLLDTKSPPPPSVGYVPPKNPDKAKGKIPAPGARGETGWLDKKGNVWVPDNDMDGGEGWRRHYPNGSHDHVYPNGKVRSHDFSFDFSPPSQETIAYITTGAMVVAGVAALILYGNPTYLQQATGS